ncbi:MAG TPA: hypothetical protein VFU76_00780 [Terriglobales bacterium]|nr:hypothetical protein [Terriglobales bacterium]
MQKQYEMLLGPRTVSHVFLASADFDLHLDERHVRLRGASSVVMQTSRPLLGGQLQPVQHEESCGRVTFTPGKASLVEIAFDLGTRMWMDCSAPESEGISYGNRGVLIVCTPGREFSLWFAPGSQPRAAAAPPVVLRNKRNSGVRQLTPRS